MEHPQKHILNDKQQAFCIEYAKHHEGRKAAIDAGYSEKTADSKASQLLRIVKIRTELKNIQDMATVNTGFTIAAAELEYDEARTLAMNQNNPTAMISATTGKARLYGYDKDNDLSGTDQQAELDDKQKQEARAIATLRLAQ